MLPETRNIIVIASVLKPVDDSRMYEKFALTLSESSFDVHVIGFPGSNFKNVVAFYELPYFNRISFRRITTPLLILKKIFGIKPKLIIITTHELLFISLVAKFILKCKVIYDVQENYFRNILHTNAFPKPLRLLVAGYVRLKEKITASFIDHFILAERGYASEVGFVNRRYTVIENKVRRPTLSRKRIQACNHLIFTGTLAETTGVFTAIDLAEALHQHDRSVTLTIIGYCSQKEVLEKIQQKIKSRAFVNLIGGNKIVPHRDILEQIAQADFGIIAYKVNPSTESSLPTKLYEYLGYQLPIILVDYKPWVNLCEDFDAAISFNPNNLDPQKLLYQMNQKAFYTSIPTNVYWEDESLKLVTLVDKLLKKS